MVIVGLIVGVLSLAVLFGLIVVYHLVVWGPLFFRLSDSRKPGKGKQFRFLLVDFFSLIGLVQIPLVAFAVLNPEAEIEMPIQLFVVCLVIALVWRFEIGILNNLEVNISWQRFMFTTFTFPAAFVGVIWGLGVVLLVFAPESRQNLSQIAIQFLTFAGWIAWSGLIRLSAGLIYRQLPSAEGKGQVRR